MDVWDMVFAGSMGITAIILLWISTNEMINKRRVMIFFPFFLSSVLLIFSSSLSFHGIFDPLVWFFMEFPWFLLTGWIILNLWRENV
jgi:hypothetical protein